MTDHRTDPAAVAHRATRTALAGTVDRLCVLLERTHGLRHRSALPRWSAGQVGAHLAAVFWAYCSAVSDEEPVDWAEVLPGGEPAFGPRMAAVNARAVALVGERTGERRAGFVAERAELFLRATAPLAPETPVATPWYGPEPALTVAASTGLLLSECLVHGLDIARATGLPWRIEPEHARLVLGQAMPVMMPLALDRERARGVDVVFDLAVRGGPRLFLAVRDGAMTVTTGAAPRTPDCRISADPVAFLLVAFRRSPQWKAVARGLLRAGGRKPWLAPRLTWLVPSP
ncbi:MULTISPECIES: maleylpyruvate isomerase N-terminal domain-containing protein [unclassified Kitasatospora]|uniref:maleylpyruvate isomerase N-terminal domain-containing protein n=1 Tax=unclassified Kitasatospora TaxID=2633591 RepID=UPI00381E587C